MKRIILLLVVSIFFIGICDASLADEILFRGLPWESNPIVLKNELKKMGFLYPASAETMILYWDTYQNTLDDRGYDTGMFTTEKCGWKVAAVNVSEEDGPRVAGYIVYSVEAYFVDDFQNNQINTNEEDAKFYFAQYGLRALDYNKAFDEIKEKLTNLYGEPETKNGKTSVWLSTDDGFLTTCNTIRCYYRDTSGTAVILETAKHDGQGVYLTITYGKSGYDETIAQMEKIISDEKYHRLIENEKNTDRSADYDGL